MLIQKQDSRVIGLSIMMLIKKIVYLFPNERMEVRDEVKGIKPKKVEKWMFGNFSTFF